MSFSAASNFASRFTGKERDAETGLDYFGARYYSGAQGMFISADWSATPEPVPYAKFEDPQTLNLYSYVRNNPTTTRDPDGYDALWVVDKQTGQVTLMIPVHITGNGVNDRGRPCAGINRHEVENERVLQERNSEPS